MFPMFDEFFPDILTKVFSLQPSGISHWSNDKDADALRLGFVCSGSLFSSFSNVFAFLFSILFLYTAFGICFLINNCP